MTWKGSLKLVIVLQLLVLLGLYVFFSSVFLQVKCEPRTFGDVSSLFPSGPADPLVLNGWKGFRLPYRFRIFCKDFPDPVEGFRELVQKSLKNPYLQKPLSLFDEGLYVIWRQPKGYNLTCLFRRAGRIYWLDMASSSTLDYCQRAFDTSILNLQVRQEAVSAKVKEELSAISRSISPWVIQRPEWFIMMLAGLFVLIWCVIYLVMRLAGACPRDKSPDLDFCTPQATLIERGLGRRTTPCCLCLEGEELVVYRFRRPYLRIPFVREKENLRLEKKAIHYQKYQILLGEEDLQRWRVRLGL